MKNKPQTFSHVTMASNLNNENDLYRNTIRTHLANIALKVVKKESSQERKNSRKKKDAMKESPPCLSCAFNQLYISWQK